MAGFDKVLSTVEMLQQEHLDVRTITLGVNLYDCSDRNPDMLCNNVRNKLLSVAGGLVAACGATSAKYGIPVVNKRIAISPVAEFAAGHSKETLLQLAHTLDEVCERASIDFVGGFSAMVQKGITPSDETLIKSLPLVLQQTKHVCASINAASTKAGINMNALLLMGEALRHIAAMTADRDGFGCCKLLVFANIPEDNPFMAGAYRGSGEPEAAVNVGVSGPGVIKRAIERLQSVGANLTVADIAEEIKNTAFRVTRAGELIGREVAKAIGVEFGIVDLSLAPTPEVGDSVGEVLHVMGISKIGGPGSTAALAMLTDAVKKGGLFASSSVGGMSGAFIPVAEDAALSAAVRDRHLTLAKLEAMTAVCSVGLDMVALPGDTPAETLAAIAADELSIGVVNKKTTGVRLIPVPGKKAGDMAHFGGLFGESPVLEVEYASADEFVRLGGRIPAPVLSLNN